MQAEFAEVVVPLALSQTYTYRIPPEMTVEPGIRVEVQFGRSKHYVGVVWELHNRTPGVPVNKAILSVLDESPFVTPSQRELWNWLSRYYLCTLGEIMVAALPASFRTNSESVLVALDPPSRDDRPAGRSAELLDIVLGAQRLTVQELARISGTRTLHKYIRYWIDCGWVMIEEDLKKGFRPKMRKHVLLHPDYRNEKALGDLLDSLGRAPRQQDLLLAYMTLSPDYNAPQAVISRDLAKKAGAGDAAVQALVKKGVLIQEELAVDRIHHYKGGKAMPTLTAQQQMATEQIKEAFQQSKPVLLHGVTGSGKTEVYVHFIRKTLDAGKNVLLLVPEIALTTQLIQRLGSFFGEDMLVYHSGFSANERAEVWLKLQRDAQPYLVLGVRSSVFLPIDRPGLIVVDEEHEYSYKQFEPAPRYHARDVALTMARRMGVQVILGSATPSVESYWLARSGSLAYVSMTERYGDAQMPEIHFADLRQESGKANPLHMFSQKLLQKIRETLEKQEQVILFQNRRGYVPKIQCETCGHIPFCVNCDIALTYHKYRHDLRCHYCGHHEKPPAVCGACGSARIHLQGFGTERIEEELRMHFPDARIQRMDHDSTRGKHNIERIIANVAEGKTDILVGTQMVTKGLDFEKVTLVGILSAEHLLAFPDFRAQERTFQLITQVAGRSGRSKAPGEVLIQTFQPDMPLLQRVANQDLEGIYRIELRERKEFNYPPYVRLIRLTLKHRDRPTVQQAALRLGDLMIPVFGHRVLGPEFPYMERIRGKYQMQILLKYERQLDAFKVRKALQDVLHRFYATQWGTKVRLIVDADPY